MQDQRTGSNDAVLPDTGRHDRALAQPRVLSNSDGFVVACLLSDRNIQQLASVLMTAIHDGNVRGNEDVLFDCNFADRTVVTDVDSPIDGNIRFGKIVPNPI